jgi:PAS domain S-box-containing protein
MGIAGAGRPGVPDDSNVRTPPARHDDILRAAGFAAQRFLSASWWEDAIEDVLERLGEAAEVSRAHVFENVTLTDGRPASTHRFEWCAPGIASQLTNPDTIDQPWGDEQDEWMARLAAGEPMAVTVRDLSEEDRAEFGRQGIVSLLDMPIFDERRWWGSIGFDDCTREREWSGAEIEALRVAASTLGAAIHRARTERNLRETEELYRTLIEQIPAVVYINRISGMELPIYTSTGIVDVLGVTPDEFMRDGRWFSMLHPDDHDRVVEENARTSRALEPFSVEYRLVRPDGRVVWVRDEAQVVRDDRGDPRFWSGVMFDITNLKRAEHELARALEIEREATARLRSLDEMKTTFLQAVSHDLRTPLAAVLGSALTLDREDVQLDDDEAKDLIRRIATNAKKLQRLVTDLLDLDRLSRGLLEPNRVPTDLSELVRTVAKESDPLVGRIVEVEATRSVVAVDAPKVERIVENLLVNAARHTPRDARIWVRVDANVAGGALIAVEDDGPGVPSSLREVVFRPFERGPSSSEHAPGAGIGLSLVSRFAELHGGRAWVEEREGGGSSFLVWLPTGPSSGERAEPSSTDR